MKKTIILTIIIFSTILFGCNKTNQTQIQSSSNNSSSSFTNSIKTQSNEYSCSPVKPGCSTGTNLSGTKN